MKAFLKLAACLLIAGTWVVLWKQTGMAPKRESSREETIARGAELVRAGGCADCHTPKIMTPHGPVDDEARLFAGHVRDVPASPDSAGNTVWEGPWGISYAANLTPDPATGLWSEASFIKTMRTGKRRGHGRALLPPMPWQEIARLPEEDLKAIYAYLASLPPVFNSVPDPVPPPDSAALSNTVKASAAF